jgi:hypothetical protein
VTAGVTWWREWGWIGSLSGATFKTKKNRQRSLRRGPPWLGLVDLSQADDALFVGSTTVSILDLIRGVELIETLDNDFLHPRLRPGRVARATISMAPARTWDWQEPRSWVNLGQAKQA